MKAGTLYALIMGGLGACALAGGVALGNFAAAGLARAERPMDQASQIQAFIDAQESRRLAQTKRASQPLPPPAQPSVGGHVCEGCDARLNKDPYLAQLAAGGAGESDLAPDAYSAAAN